MRRVGQRWVVPTRKENARKVVKARCWRLNVQKVVGEDAPPGFPMRAQRRDAVGALRVLGDEGCEVRILG